LSADTRASWQFGCRERLAYSVMRDICNVAHSFQKAKGMQDSGVDTDANVRIARFDAL